MDEAFSALDPLIRHEMQSELIRLQREQNRTIVFISHDLDEAIRIGDRIAIMEGGRVVQIGSPKEIMRNPADDYVANFFKGVDISKLLQASDIACEKSPKQILVNGQTNDVVADQDFGYLVDDSKMLHGVVSLKDSRSDNLTTDELKPLEIDNYQAIYSDEYVKDVLNKVANTPYPVPVIERDGTFRGAISKDELLLTLSND
jgi:glycine betaine/proline transport system ATP-binding protein